MTNYTIAFWLANQGTLDAGPNFNIDDTASNISANLNALNDDSHISQIIVLDNAPVVVNVAKLTVDAVALSKLINQDNSAATLTVSDTALHIGNGFATIGTDSQVTLIKVSDNTAVTLNASQVVNNGAALGELINANGSAAHVTVQDSAIHISAALDAINSHVSTITSIVVSNSIVMTLTAAQIANDGAALAEVTNNNGNPVSFKVADTGANIAAHLGALQANVQITSITDTDNSPITLSIAQFTSDAGALAKIVDADHSPVAFTVSDSAANISAAFDSLNANSHVTKIVVTNSASHEVTISAASAGSDSAALGELYVSDGVTAAHVAVSDTAAAISAALDALNTNSHVNKIIISDSNPLALTASQVANDTTALGEISGAYTIGVSDTAAAITANLDALQANGNVTAIVVSDSAEITVSVAQLTSDSTVIGELSNQNASPVHVIVSDTAAHVASAFDSLNGNMLVNKIVVSDSASNEVTISVSQAATDTAALGELFQSDGATPAHVAVSDTASAISAAFDTLNANTHVNKIVVSDSATNEVTISVTQAANDTTALTELLQSGGVTAASVAVSDIASAISGAFDALSANTHVNKIIVSDSASNEVTISVASAGSDGTALGELFQSDGVTHAHVAVSDAASAISAAFDTLNVNTHVNKIIVSDSASNEVTISAAQAASDTAALAELLQSDGVTAASVAVSDIASAISAAFDALSANIHVNKIIVSDSASNEVTISVASAGSDGTALGELFQSDGATHAHVGVSDTASAISAAFDALNANTHVNKIVVSDSASNEVTISVASAGSDGAALGELFQSDGTTHAYVAVSDAASAISAAFDALNANSHVNKIIVDNSAPHSPNIPHEVTISVTQLGSDTTALGDLVQSDGTTPAHVAIFDTAAAISGAFDTLNANTQVDSIIISDSNPLALTASQVANDTTALGEISGAYTIGVSDTAAAITANLDALQANGNVTAIVVSDSAEITVSVAQLTSDSTVIGELSNQNASPVHVIVSDTAAHVASAFDSLNGNMLVNKIVVSDSASNEVTISVSQAATDTAALGELFQFGGTTPAHVAVSDTASAISAAFDTLNANTHVNKIVVSDSATNEVTISVTQLGSDGTALGELRNSDGSTPVHVAIADTAAHISTAFDTLNGNNQVNKIIISNSASAEVTISVAQAAGDTVALAELFQSNGTTQAHVAVSDTAAHISAALNTLNGDSQVDTIIVSDNGAITLSASAAVNDSTAIGELQNANHSPVSLIVSDTALNIATYLDQLNGESNISSIVISDSAPLTLTAVQVGADTSALGKLSDADASGVTINVVDTAAGISANLDALQANSDIASITVSDNAPITVSVAQLTSDSVVLSELTNADSSPIFLTVKDTAAHILANIATLGQNSEITSIVISNNLPLTLSIAQLSADAGVLSIVHNANGTPYTLTISDNATNISNAFDALNANTHVTSIVDTTSTAITVNVSQITSDATALGELVNGNSAPYTLSVHDTAAHIAAAFDALNGNTHVASIVVTDSASNEVTLSASQFTNDTTALSELFQADGTTQAHVAVSDLAANISGAFDALGASSQVNKIVVTDSATQEVVVKVGQLTSDATALAELFNSDGTTHAHVTVSDIATNVTAALNTLDANAQVNKIVVSDSASNEVVVSVAQITSDSAALSELFNSDGTTHANVTVSDVAANIDTALGSLNGNSQVNKIVVSDSASNELVVSVAQLASDATALAELFNADGTTHANVTASDTAAHISSAFNALSADGQVNKIVVSDSASNEVTLLAAQITNDASALSELFNSNGSTLANVKVSDTAAHISSAFDALNASTQVNKIVVTDSASNEITISVAQLTGDTVALGELFQSNGTTQAHVAVSDTAANISSALGVLNHDSQVDKIVINDGNPLTLNASQVVHDTTALGEISGSYMIVVTDTAGHITANLDALQANSNITLVVVSNNAAITVNIAQLTSDADVLGELVNASGTPAALKVVDTAANIQSNLGSLTVDSLDHNIAAIVISDNGPITLSASQLAIDLPALSDLHNANGSTVSLTLSDTAANIQSAIDSIQAYNNTVAASQITSIVVSNNAALTLTAAQIFNDASALEDVTNRNGSSVSFKVVDTAAAVSTYLNALQANGQISSITLSDNAAVDVSIAQLTSDAVAIGKLHDQNGSPYSLTVVDSAADISAALNNLNGNSHVHQIDVSDSATNEVKFSVTQLTHDSNVLGELYDADGTTRASVKLFDTGGHIAALSAGEIAALASEGVNTIDASNNALSLSVAQYEALGSVTLTAANAVTLLDSGAHIASLTAAQIGALAANGIDLINVSDKAVTLSLAQWDALGSMAIGSKDVVTIDGTAANDVITAGTSKDVLVGGGGTDLLTAGSAHDVFVYNAVSDSTSTNYDTIVGFNAKADDFQFSSSVTAVDAAVTHGTLDSGANFDTELATDIAAAQLGAHHAVLFTATSGSLAGDTFLIVDANGVAGYQAGQDFVIELNGASNLSHLNISDFVS